MSKYKNMRFNALLSKRDVKTYYQAIVNRPSDLCGVKVDFNHDFLY